MRIISNYVIKNLCSVDKEGNYFECPPRSLYNQYEKHVHTTKFSVVVDFRNRWNSRRKFFSSEMI